MFDGPNEWYGGKFQAIWLQVTQAGLDCIPYGFHYGFDKGSDLDTEVVLAAKYANNYPNYCADMESSFDGQGDWTLQVQKFFKAQAPGKQMIVSTWANIDGTISPGHSWYTNVANLAPVTKFYMPQAYSDFYTDRLADWSRTTVPAQQIMPTLNLGTSDMGQNDVLRNLRTIINTYHPSLISLWEYQDAVANPGLLDQVVAAIHQEVPTMATLQTNSAGEIANFVNVSQFLGQHSEFACGPFAAGHVKFTTDPTKKNTTNPADIQNWAFNEYASVIGPDTISNTDGSSIDNMHTFYHDAGYHYWDISGIDANSQHATDIARIKRALQAGYPVVATVAETSVFDVAEGKNPYFWGPAGNHILVYSGIAKSGNLLAQDTANILGSLTGANNPNPGPREYDVNKLFHSYACTIQLSWLAPIPDGDPLNWPTGFVAQQLATPQPQSQGDPNANNEQVLDAWAVGAAFVKAAEGNDISQARGTRIFGTWRDQWINHANYLGVPMSSERTLKALDGSTFVRQHFTGGYIDFARNVCIIRKVGA